MQLKQLNNQIGSLLEMKLPRVMRAPIIKEFYNFKVGYLFFIISYGYIG
ncbi:hypothetical protein AAX29_00579 [Aliarcobacter thereius]|uniref:Uncharacterized protein n=1 Tax=Aliarcobacter thereius TaxID=544718 RepID=A0A1C0B7G4_9BACT|nr:hypothetical protein AAX29_00579 [Aliarcobacter thereius]